MSEALLEILKPFHRTADEEGHRVELDIDAFYKASACASLYKSYGKTLYSIKAGDVTYIWSGRQSYMDCFIILRNMIIWYQALTM